MRNRGFGRGRVLTMSKLAEIMERDRGKWAVVGGSRLHCNSVGDLIIGFIGMEMGGGKRVHQITYAKGATQRDFTFDDADVVIIHRPEVDRLRLVSGANGEDLLVMRHMDFVTKRNSLKQRRQEQRARAEEELRHRIENPGLEIQQRAQEAIQNSGSSFLFDKGNNELVLIASGQICLRIPLNRDKVGTVIVLSKIGPSVEISFKTHIKECETCGEHKWHEVFINGCEVATVDEE